MRNKAINCCRAVYYLLAAITAVHMQDKDLSELNAFEAYLWYKSYMRLTNFEIVQRGDYYGYEAGPLVGAPAVISSWEDLAKLEPVGDVTLEIDLEYGNGDVCYKGESVYYLTTHSLYESEAAGTENLLRSYGFNVKVIGY